MIEEKTEIIEPFNGNALEYLQTIYRNPVQEQHTRMRAAALAIAYESPKLAVTASVPYDETFANLLDRARKRSARVMVIPATIEQRPEPVQPATVEIKPHLPTVPDRRYRRY
jgi:hypothetical protein